jgi:hypothetical protein
MLVVDYHRPVGIYKAFENIGGWQRIGLKIDTRTAVFFGLAHGFGHPLLQELTWRAGSGCQYHRLQRRRAGCCGAG